MFDSIRALSVIKGGAEKLYAYIYQPNSAEKKYNGWAVYNAEREFRRQGVESEQCKGWRFSKINHNYEVCSGFMAVLFDSLMVVASSRRHIPRHLLSPPQ